MLKSYILFCPKPPKIQFSITHNREKQQILTMKTAVIVYMSQTMTEEEYRIR